MDYHIVPMHTDDWPAVREIYGEGIATGHATLETELPHWEKWNSSHRPDCRLVAREKERVLGWAALSSVSARHAYHGVAEVSVYVMASAHGRGVGRALLSALITGSEEAGLWTLQAGILVQNAASTVLHSSCGFREVGVRQRIGKLGDAWRDVLLMERRSAKVGC